VGHHHCDQEQCRDVVQDIDNAPGIYPEPVRVFTNISPPVTTVVKTTAAKA
jgi:hypothetical protein